ncbi:MAG: SoxR reducing system RseC family protein [Bacteroidales bacterium]
MPHNKDIKHPGIIEQVLPHQLQVRITQQSACSKCHSNSYCSMADSSDKLVEVATPPGTTWRTGQPVTVFLSESLGYRALLLGYLLPFLILLLSLIVMVTLTGNEGLSALVAILLMAPYYALLYRMRHRLAKRFEFRISN